MFESVPLLEWRVLVCVEFREEFGQFPFVELVLIGIHPRFGKPIWRALVCAIASMHWICWNHLKWVSLKLSPIDAIPKCSRKCSFLTLIFPSFTTHPSQHSHLCYAHFLDVVFPNWLTLYAIGHSLSNCYLVKFSFNPAGMRWSQSSSKASLHFNHPTFILYSTSFSTHMY